MLNLPTDWIFRAHLHFAPPAKAAIKHSPHEQSAELLCQKHRDFLTAKFFAKNDEG